MSQQATSAVSQPQLIETLLSRTGAPNAPAMTEELHPFTVRLVRDEDDLNKAVQIRHSAYARHLPDFAETLKSAENADADNGVVVLLAEATRLGVTNEKGGHLVTTVLFKAYFQYCQQIGIEWIVVTGRAPVDRMYDRLLFKDVYPGMGYIPLSHVSGLPHRVLSQEVDSVEPNWAAAKQPLYEFFFHTHLPDHPILPRSRWTSAVHLHLPPTLAANQGPGHLACFLNATDQKSAFHGGARQATCRLFHAAN